MVEELLPPLPLCIDIYPEGAMYAPSDVPLPIDPRSATREELALARYKLWEPGQILRVRFMEANGDEELHRRVAEHARKWLLYANLDFEFGHFTNAEIRISFAGHGYRSYVGTDALQVPTSQPTMILGGFTRHTDDVEMQRVVLHEFGHALGCVHEQANPAINIPWDVEKVYAYYKQYAGWGKKKIEQNVLLRYSQDEVHYTEHDPESIMQYPVQKELTVGGFEIGWNNTLSPRDIQFIQAMYPGHAAPEA